MSEALTPHQMMMAMRGLDNNASLRTALPAAWVVFIPAADFVIGAETPESAISEAWKKLSNGDEITLDRGARTERIVSWNGFMWVVHPKPRKPRAKKPADTSTTAKGS